MKPGDKITKLDDPTVEAVVVVEVHADYLIVQAPDGFRYTTNPTEWRGKAGST